MNKFKVILTALTVLFVCWLSYIMMTPNTVDVADKEAIKGTSVKWETFDEENIIGVNDITLDGKSVEYLDDFLPVVRIFAKNQNQIPGWGSI